MALALGQLPFVQTIELKTYDWRLRATADPAAARRDIVLVTIDEDSVRGLEPLVGRWPWPRLVHAQLLNFLARAQPTVVLYDVLFTERDRTRFVVEDEEWTGTQSDEALAEAARNLRVLVPLANTVPEAGGNTGTGDDATVPGSLPGPRLPFNEGIEPRPVLSLPFPELLEGSLAVAQNFGVIDPDGVLRRYVPLVRHGERVVPSVAVAGAIAALGLRGEDVRLDPGGLRLGDRVLPLVSRPIPSYDGTRRVGRRALVTYRGGRQGGTATYETYSFYKLFYAEQQLLGEQRPVVDPAVFRGKVVVVGATAAGTHDAFVTPVDGKMAGAEVHAAVIDSILSNRFLAEASWSAGAAVTVSAGVVLGIACVLLGPWTATAAALVGAGLTIAATTWQFGQGIWLPLVPPLVAIALATFGGVAYQYFVEGREKRRVKRLFSRYVSKDVYDQLIANPEDARLGGQRRFMTVLFSDIRGFTSVSEQGEPEEIVGQLNEYFSRMVPIVFAHHGTIDKFVGDMIMALFGAPLDDPDHADHAVQTALAMSAGLAELNRGWAAAGRPVLDIGIGINTGDMVAGNLGSESIMSYTVIGDNVNLGARLESLNKDHQTRVIISEATRRALRGQYDIGALGEVVVKGKSRAVQIYSVVPPRAVLDGLNAEVLATDRSPVAADGLPVKEERAKT